jgi:uncharacterized protein YkwD
MKQLLVFLGFVSLAALSPGCSKSGKDANGNPVQPPDRVKNGVKVSEATSALNAYRTNGFSTYPATTSLTWNDTLSDAAFKFAQDIASQGDGTGGTVYQTATGGDILQYPALVGYVGSATLAQCFVYPDTADVKSMIDDAFKDANNSQIFFPAIMDPKTKKFGMGEFNNRWYLIAGH